MNFKILPTKEFSKDFKKLDKFMQERIKKKIEEVAEADEELLISLIKGLEDIKAGRIKPWKKSTN